MIISSEQISRSGILLLLFFKDCLDNFWLTSYSNKKKLYLELKKTNHFHWTLSSEVSNWLLYSPLPDTEGRNPWHSFVPGLHLQVSSTNCCFAPQVSSITLLLLTSSVFNFFFHLLIPPALELSALRAFKPLFHNNSYYLLSCYYVPDTLPNFVHSFSLLILMCLMCMYYFCLHFAHEETEPWERKKQFDQGHTANKE